MKRFLTLFFLLFMAVQLSAQSGLNNLGFENWSEDNAFTRPQPNGLGSIGQSPLTSNTPEGDTALRLTTKEFQISATEKDTAGITVLGEITLSGVQLGDGFSKCPDSLTGSIRFDLPNQDTGIIASRVWNSTDTLAVADTMVGGTDDTWHSFNIPFQPMDCGGMTPDSIALVFSSEAVVPEINMDVGTQTPGTGYLDLDGVEIWAQGTTTTSLTELAKDSKAAFELHPNPASSTVQLEHGTLEKRVKIFDMTGRNVRTVQLGNAKSRQVSVSNMDEGLYIYRVEGSKGEQLHSGKLQVIH